MSTDLSWLIFIQLLILMMILGKIKISEPIQQNRILGATKGKPNCKKVNQLLCKLGWHPSQKQASKGTTCLRAFTKGWDLWYILELKWWPKYNTYSLSLPRLHSSLFGKACCFKDHFTINSFDLDLVQEAHRALCHCWLWELSRS